MICTKFLGIGSTVLSIPLLRALKREEIHVAFWTFNGPAELAEYTGLVDEVWTIKPTLTGFLPSLIKTWWISIRYNADTFIDLEPTANFTAILSVLSGSSARIGFKTGKSVRESLFTHLVDFDQNQHMTENFCNLLTPLGIQSETEQKSNPVLETANKAIKQPNQNIRILININASDLSWQRKWPNEHWVSLCHQLLTKPNIEIFFTGSIHESKNVEEVIRKTGNSNRMLNLAGKTSISSLIQIIDDCDLVVSVDSGLMHLASMTRTPLVALFGPESPSLYGPRNDRTLILNKRLGCSPCLKTSNNKVTHCLDNQCMKLISPEEVYQACKTHVTV